MSGESNFGEFLRSTVVGALSKILGGSASQSLLYHTGFEGTLAEPRRFHEKLLSFLGEGGARTVETSIVKALFAKLLSPVPVTESGFDYEECVRAAHDLFEKRFVKA